MLEPERHPEPIAKRRRQQPGTGGCADQRERWQVERQRSRGGPLPDHDVEPEVLQRWVEDLFNGARDAVDLVDEEDVALVETGQDRGHVALALERGPGDRAQSDAELFASDVGEARLAQAGRADQEQVVERLVAGAGGLEGDRELLLDAVLADEIVQRPGAERPFELVLFRSDRWCQELRLFRCLARHAAFFNASRTRSSGGVSGSVPASAASASAIE